MCHPKEHPPNFFEMSLYISCPLHCRTYVSITPYLVVLISLLYPHSSTVYATAFFMAHPCPETPVANYGKALRLHFEFFLLCLLSSKSSTVALSFLSFPKLFPPIKTAADIITYLRHQNQITGILYLNPWAFYILSFILSH